MAVANVGRSQKCILTNWHVCFVNSQHYLHLYAALFGPHTDEINSVFDKVVDDFEHWQRTLVTDLASKLVDGIKAKSMAYRRDNWNDMPDRDARQPFMISTTAGEMFQVIL